VNVYFDNASGARHRSPEVNLLIAADFIRDRDIVVMCEPRHHLLGARAPRRRSARTWAQGSFAMITFTPLLGSISRIVASR
jgi:hypothetical protein